MGRTNISGPGRRGKSRTSRVNVFRNKRKATQSPRRGSRGRTGSLSDAPESSRKIKTRQCLLNLGTVVSFGPHKNHFREEVRKEVQWCAGKCLTRGSLKDSQHG